jgi:hypothetical protein
VIFALLNVALAACPAKAPAWGTNDEAPLLRHAEIIQLVSDSQCRTWVLTRRPNAVLRLEPNGAPSADFASNGALALEATPSQLLLDEAHERLLVLGALNGPQGTVARVHAWNLEGIPKRAFGKAGVVQVEGRRLSPTGAQSSGAVVGAVFDDGAVLLVLQVASPVKPESAVYVTRLDFDGAVALPVITPSFVTGPMAGGAPHLARAGPDGAWFFTSSGTEGALARFDAHGRLDPEVGEGGVVRCLAVSYANELVTDGDGVLLGGTAAGYRQLVERRGATGALDRAFGVNGQIFFKADPRHLEHVRALHRTAAGVLVLIASYDRQRNASTAGLECWGTNGRLDPAFGFRGVRWLTRDTPTTDVTAVTEDALGRILVALNVGTSLGDSKTSSSVLNVDLQGPRARPPMLLEARTPKAKPAVPEVIWQYTDEKGVTNYVNALEAVPLEFKKNAKPFRSP